MLVAVTLPAFSSHFGLFASVEHCRGQLPVSGVHGKKRITFHFHTQSSVAS